MALSTLIVPVLLTFTACFALGKRVDVYSALTKGAEEGLTVLLHILPSLIALLSVYYGAAGITKTRYTIPAALCADVVMFLASAFFVRLLMGA